MSPLRLSKSATLLYYLGTNDPAIAAALGTATDIFAEELKKRS